MAAAAALALELDERENNTKNIVNINNKTSSWTYYSRTRQLLSRMGDNK